MKHVAMLLVSDFVANIASKRCLINRDDSLTPRKERSMLFESSKK